MEIKNIKLNTKNNMKIENNTQKTTLKINDKQYKFCILDITGNTVTIKEGNMITQTGTEDPRIKEIIPILLNPPKKAPKKETKKNTKKETRKCKQ